MAFVRPIPEDTESQQDPVPTWETHIVIPVVQNILGGLSVGAAWMGVTIALQFWNIQFDLYNAGIFASLAGGAWAIFWNIVRFSGDEIGIVTAAYRMGHADERAALMLRIAALELELRASYDAQTAAQVMGSATAGINKRQEEMSRARQDAFKIIEVAFNGDKTSREAMKSRGIGQRDWERAYRLLIACGVMRDDGVILAATPNEAYAAIDDQLGRDGKTSDTFVPKWM